MPCVKHPDVLRAVYRATLKAIEAGELTTELLGPERFVYRATDLGRFLIYPNGAVNKKEVGKLLEVRDENTDRNRFSGASKNADVPSHGGLYCSLQQSALVNELVHYAGKQIPRDGLGRPSVAHTLEAKSIMKIRLMGAVHVADVSPHNPGARRLVESIGKSSEVQKALHSAGTLGAWIWDRLFDGEDCSVARGVGLAVAKTGYRGLQASTVRPSARSHEETGDNLVLFGHNGSTPPGLMIEEVYLFPRNQKPLALRAEFFT